MSDLSSIVTSAVSGEWSADKYDQWERYERGEITLEKAMEMERQEWGDLGHTPEDIKKNVGDVIGRK